VGGVLSPDVDALLFGAQRVVKALRLQVANVRGAEMQVRPGGWGGWGRGAPP
jgi:hypothetical protein